MIYLDNSSTTHKKPKCVIRAIAKGLKQYNYNPGRGGYNNAIRANLKVLELRNIATLFFGAEDCTNVIITKSCTEATNIALRSNPKKNGHIISTIYEHNSTLRTLDYLYKNFGISYTLLKPNKDGKICASDVEKSIKQNTYMVAINHISNVTGCVQDIANIGGICKKHNLIYLVDGAQSAGHKDINMRTMNINYLSISGHKGVFGPQGIGLLICNNATPTPLIFGGTGTYSESVTQPIDLPEGLESGTMSMANIMGLTAGIKYTMKHLRKIEEKITKLTLYIVTELSKIKKVKLFSNIDSCGVISFNIEGKTSTEVATELDARGYEIRSGLHCAPKVHEYYKTTNVGMCRVGLSYFNTMRQVKKLVKTIKEM